MILGIDRMGARLKEQYDKVIAFTVLVLLVFSLVYLVISVGRIQKMQEESDHWLHSQTPVNPTAEEISSDGYDTALDSLAHPFVLKLGCYTNTTGSLFVPQTRFSCLECRRPVYVDAEKCPFCGKPTVKEEIIDPDPDRDGMPTEWEEKYGLDPFDPSDADKDNDGDGYTNLEEYREGPFDPINPKSHPALVEKLVLSSITGEKFGMLFKSRIKTSKGNMFVLNYRLPNGEVKTAFARIGETVAGATLNKYTENLVRVHKNSPREDHSTLTIITKRGDPIVLEIGKPTKRVRLTAHLVLPRPGGKNLKFDVSEKDKFEIEGAVYRVITIDGNKERVVVQDDISKRKTVVTKGAVNSDQSGD